MRASSQLWRVAAVAASLVTIQGLAGMTASASATPPTTLAESVAAVKNGTATDLGSYDTSAPLRLSIGLRAPHPAAEQAFLQSLQDKRSPQYHSYLSPAEWTARFGPSATSEAAVVKWATGAGLTVTQRYPNRLVVDVSGSAGTIAKALHVGIRNYRLGSIAFFANDRNPALPQSLAGVVESIGGLDSLHRMKPASSATAPVTPDFSAGAVSALSVSGGANGSRSALALAQKRSAAKLAAAKRAAKTLQGQSASAPASFTGGFYDPTDVYSSHAYDLDALYAQGHCCNPFSNPGGTPKETSIAIATIGGHDPNDYLGFHNAFPYLAYHFFEHFVDGTPTCCDFEGTMDFEWATAWSNSFGSLNDTSTVHMYDGATNFQSTFTDIYNTMVSQDGARVMSTSWSCAEGSGPHFPCDNNIRNTQHNIFNNMVGLGWSLVGDSGDQGAFGDCQSLGVEFPASDPNFTAAGGTELGLSAGPVYGSEVAWSGSTAPGSCSRNGGGSTGGCSIDYAAPAYQNSTLRCGSGSRSVPDISLNAFFGQNTFFGGRLLGGGGTSIVAPEFAGFLAQQNAYGVFLGAICGLGSGTSPCAPLGQANPVLYQAMGGLSPHNPTYDITSGCNSNDIGGGFCAGTGYDLVTGWGSANMLQLAWAMNYRTVAEGAAPSVIFSGPTTGTWVNFDQQVFWAVIDNGGIFHQSGVAGYSSGWDGVPADPFSHATPGSGDSFYAGPQRPSQSGGVINLFSAGQGCHTTHVRGWDNMGLSSGDSTFGPLCLDTVAPTVTGPQPRLETQTTVTPNGVPVHLTWTGSDATSGVVSYDVTKRVDGGAFTFVGTFSAPTATLNLPAGHSYQFGVNAVDRAGNRSSTLLGRSFRVNLAQEVSNQVVYGGAWTTQAVTGASGGKVRFATVAGRSSKLTFNGFAAAWVTTRASNRGSATVSFDGRSPSTVSTQVSGPQQPAQIVFTQNVSSGAHSVLVKVLGSNGHPRVDVDAFAFLS